MRVIGGPQLGWGGIGEFSGTSPPHPVVVENREGRATFDEERQGADDREAADFSRTFGGRPRFTLRP